MKLKVDERTMTASLTLENEDGGEEEIVLPVRYEVCWRCKGRGSHCNPNIDGNGITAGEWAEWDDEEKDTYLSGGYDVVCEKCDGRRVLPEVDRENADEKAVTIYDEWEESESLSRAEEAQERRYFERFER